MFVLLLFQQWARLLPSTCAEGARCKGGSGAMALCVVSERQCGCRLRWHCCGAVQRVTTRSRSNECWQPVEDLHLYWDFAERY